MQRLSSGQIDTYSMEKRDVRKDGGVVWVEANRAVVRDPDGDPVLFVGAVRDITAQRDAEAEVRTLNAGLEARVERRTADLAWRTRTWRRSATRSPMTCAPRSGR